VAAGLFAVVVIALAAVPSRIHRPTARELREELLAEIRPIALKNCEMRRFGGQYDGGYLMCGNLLGAVQSAYSYGIGPTDDWGCDVSQSFNVPVHQYDCFSPPLAACTNKRSLFHDECVGPRADRIDGRVFDTITRQIARNGDMGKTLVMKIDIEGAELDSVLATSDSVFARVDQLAMEIHGTNRRFLAMVRKLKRTFHVVHLHFNNLACKPLSARPLPAWAYQVLFVNKRVGIVDPAAPPPPLPHPLDAPDFAVGGDCQQIGEISR
jgi:hypothetical protein